METDMENTASVAEVGENSILMMNFLKIFRTLLMPPSKTTATMTHYVNFIQNKSPKLKIG
jgi:hypothetical protein